MTRPRLVRLYVLPFVLLGTLPVSAQQQTFDLLIIKYDDLDQDGTNNEINTSPGSGLSGNALTGWEFTVYDSQGNEVGRNTTSVENAGANGDLGIRSSIPGLISGEEYTICETQQAGWVNTEPGTISAVYNEPCQTVTVTSNTIGIRYFGNYRTDESLAGPPTPVPVAGPLGMGLLASLLAGVGLIRLRRRQG